MKSPQKPIRLPKDFRETVVALNIDPAALLQRYIDSLCYYPNLLPQEEAYHSNEWFRITIGMMDYQLSGKVFMDPDLSEINLKYLKLLIAKNADRSKGKKQHEQECKDLIDKWGMEARPLLNYPEEIILEGGGVVRLSFSYQLRFTGSDRTIREVLQFMMRSLSLANLHARKYADKVYENDKLMKFFSGLWRHQEGVFLPCSTRKSSVISSRFRELVRSKNSVKSFQGRLVIFRAFVKEWYHYVNRMNG
ncbi:hypothetical protein [Pedobacter hartonius]|uniref:Uncharacterized protein n=1 Tax=Pedobacter hartonius TaxID=425514 RepID=A0A1H4CXR2_9SPHI|nr:hypothetical protein [Pedobacter hartonius]SEA65177.1 hypothetical protein SAMN05443550_104240 [Pedobacter hartonius]